jgi:hypothetical protein
MENKTTAASVPFRIRVVGRNFFLLRPHGTLPVNLGILAGLLDRSRSRWLNSDKYPPFCAKYHFSFAITPFLLATFLGTASGQIPAPRTFAPSAFPSPPKKSTETPIIK